MTGARMMPRWPLFLIASPAAVAIWSGWVGLGGLCGFGPIHPLPGIADGFTINTAITLPVGVEAYGAYALRAWLTPGVPERAQSFARKSAIGALALGMCGQVIYHLLAAVHAVRAPWPVVVLVSCIPVVTLGFGAALTHLLRVAPAGDLLPFPGALPGDSGTVVEVTPAADPGVTPETALEVTPHPALEAVPVIPARPPGALPGDPGEAAGTGDPGAAGRVLRRRPRGRTASRPSGRSSVSGRSATTPRATCTTTWRRPWPPPDPKLPGLAPTARKTARPGPPTSPLKGGRRGLPYPAQASPHVRGVPRLRRRHRTLAGRDP